MNRRLLLCFALIAIEAVSGSPSPLQPYKEYDHSIELEKSTAQLWWSVNEDKQTITFELHVKTTGWIALGISPAGGMRGADIAVGWVDRSSKAFLQDRFAVGNSKPMIDNTTQDWLLLRGQEKDGWTAIQFERVFDTCDSMDVPIKSGTNVLIYAYGLVDPDGSSSQPDISYHQGRRGTRILPLRSYSNQPTGDLLAGLEHIEFRFDNHAIPSADTTYHCKVFKTPSNFQAKRHAVAHEILIDSRNLNVLHHLDLFECNPKDVADMTTLPDGLCDDITGQTRMCSANLATAWAIGADPVTIYPNEAGYPITNEASPKYYMIKVHYDNQAMASNLRDSSGIRFYLGNELRPNDLGYMLFGTLSNAISLAIPPNVDELIVDAFCPSEATRNFPASGVNVVSALPHTHLQGRSVWTKLIRNNTAVQYLFNAEVFDFNHQFENRLPKPIKLYPGDAFATRCVYSTTDKNDITLGGQRTIDEMCSHTFAYYPFMNGLSACMTFIDWPAWQTKMNSSSPINSTHLERWLKSLTWTRESANEWQQFYNTAQRGVSIVRAGQMASQTLPTFPKYNDLESVSCNPKPSVTTTESSSGTSRSSITHESKLSSLVLIAFMFKSVV